MSSYLLKASSEEMAAWKAAAERSGAPSFAEWLREAANAHLSGDVIAEQPVLVHGDGRPLEEVGEKIALEKAEPAAAAEDEEQSLPARRASASASSSAIENLASRRGGKLDPKCSNASMHWRIEPGNLCTYCGGSR